MGPSPHNPFSNNPHDPFQPPGAIQKTKQDFFRAISIFWDSIHAELDRIKPDEWSGYRCELDVGWIPQSANYQIVATVRDGISDQSIEITSPLLWDIIVSLHKAYQDFDPTIEWKKAVVDQYWDKDLKKWTKRTSMEYGRAVLNSAGSNEKDSQGRRYGMS